MDRVFCFLSFLLGGYSLLGAPLWEHGSGLSQVKCKCAIQFPSSHQDGGPGICVRLGVGAASPRLAGIREWVTQRRAAAHPVSEI